MNDTKPKLHLVRPVFAESEGEGDTLQHKVVQDFERRREQEAKMARKRQREAQLRNFVSGILFLLLFVVCAFGLWVKFGNPNSVAKMMPRWLKMQEVARGCVQCAVADDAIKPTLVLKEDAASANVILNRFHKERVRAIEKSVSNSPAK